MGRDHRGHQLAVVLAAVLCVALVITATVVELKSVGDDASLGAGANGVSAQEQGDEKFLASGSDGEGLLDSAFDLVGLDGEGPTRSWEAASVEEGASQLLDKYAQDSACVLVQSGYLDLQGRVWGCVVMGESWADICVVKQGDSNKTARVLCWRIDQESVAQELGG